MMNNTIYDFIIFSLTGAFFITILGISRLFIKKIGYILSGIGIASFLIHTILTFDFHKIDIFYSLLVFVGSLLVFLFDIKYIMKSSRVGFLEQKSFLGVIFMIVFSLLGIFLLFFIFSKNSHPQILCLNQLQNHFPAQNLKNFIKLNCDL